MLPLLKRIIKRIVLLRQKLLALKEVQRLGAAIFIITVSGCATDKFDNRPIAISKISNNLLTKSLTTDDLRACTTKHPPKDSVDWPPSEWSLNSMTTAAFCMNIDIQAARLKLDIAIAAVTTAAQRPNPVVQLPLQKTLKPSTGQSPWSLGLALDFPIETAGKRDLRMLVANDNVAAAQLNISRVSWAVRSQLRLLLLSLWFSEERTKLLQKQVEIEERLEQLIEHRSVVGYASTFEVSQQWHALVQARKNIAGNLQDVDSVKIKIASLVGVRTSAFGLTPFNVREFGNLRAIPPDEKTRLSVLQNRADVLSSLVDYESSQSALQLEVAKQYPDLHLGPGYTLDQGSRKIGLTFSGLELPLFNQNQGAIAEARGRRLEAESKVKKMVETAFLETDLATKAYDASIIAFNYAQTQYSFAGRRLAAAHASLFSGEDDQISVLSAEKSKVDSELNLLDAILQIQHAIGQIEDAMQHPLHEPIPQ